MKCSKLPTVNVAVIVIVLVPPCSSTVLQGAGDISVVIFIYQAQLLTRHFRSLWLGALGGLCCPGSQVQCRWVMGEDGRI